EINNPLSNISTSAEILFEEFDNLDPEYRKELIDQVVRETDRAKDIVRSVLEYTRDREFRKSEVKLLNLVSETMRFVRSDMPPHITLTVDIPEGLIVNVDKQKIQHALLNLIKNSIDAIPDKNREEKITIKAEEHNNREVKIMITDTGVGIPEATIERIFDPFFTTKDIGKGTGLGLFVSHYIIEQHNGTISVSSRPGKGTTFTIILPAKGREQ
ncbi:MAG TPA: GHKL domain-containing protein, partial [Nitrospirae bacterium]|nr:GHKL domain-containing protein [Nitrospirota bacterium]